MMLTRRTQSGRAQDGHAQDVLSILRVINNDRTRIRRSATVLSRCSMSTEQLHLSWGRVAPPRHSSSLPPPLSLLVVVPPQSSRQAPILSATGAVTGSVSCVVAYLRLSSFLVERSASPYTLGDPKEQGVQRTNDYYKNITPLHACVQCRVGNNT